METAFFFRSNPASNNPSAGIINNTRLEAISIQAVSPLSIGKFFFIEAIVNIIVFLDTFTIKGRKTFFNERTEVILLDKDRCGNSTE